MSQAGVIILQMMILQVSQILEIILQMNTSSDIESGVMIFQVG